MIRLFRLSVAAIVLLAFGLHFQPAAAQPPEETSDETARNDRLDFMKTFWSEYQLFDGIEPKRPLETTLDPVLRWSNPVRNFFSDGALFLWLDGQRPVAAATVSIRGGGSVWLETASLNSAPLRCLRNGRDYWTPQSAGVAQQRLADAPSPAASPALRLAQMRRLCEQFALRTEAAGEQPTSLRLMTQPVYRFEKTAAGILDGALFAFTETTDPEALLLLEAVQAEGNEPAHWRHTLARMTSRPLVARRNDTIVWSAPGYWEKQRSPTDAYQERQLSIYPPPIR